ncbi:hypothetical protein BHM03_00018794 [Ensete ventricosum]|nr:hypothetical protein BHM03_00018794 [Ensete ventricosum]
MAEMGCDPELRLSLGSGYRIRLVSSLKAGSGCFVSLVESFLSGCVAFRVEQQRRKTQQKKMTMFYQGRVCVCDATEIQVCCFSRFVFYSVIAIISMAKREMEDTVTKKQQRQSTEEEEEEPSSRAVAPQVLDPGLSMKRSLQLFLQKRKARLSDATPYGFCVDGVVELLGVVLRCQFDLVPVDYVNLLTSVVIRISDSDWDRLSEVITLASRGREALALLPKGDFILTGEEVARTFGLTPVVTSGMAESYDGSVGAVVWGEDMVRHVALMMRGGGVGWRSVRTPLPRMLTSPSTWSSERT